MNRSEVNGGTTRYAYTASWQQVAGLVDSSRYCHQHVNYSCTVS